MTRLCTTQLPTGKAIVNLGVIDLVLLYLGSFFIRSLQWGDHDNHGPGLVTLFSDPESILFQFISINQSVIAIGCVVCARCGCGWLGRGASLCPLICLKSLILNALHIICNKILERICSPSSLYVKITKPYNELIS